MKKERRLSSKVKRERKAQINEELKAFIQKHKNQIVTKGREDLGQELSANKLYRMFKSNFNERLEQSGNEYSIKNAREAMERTLHTETFTGAKVIDYENLRSELIQAKKWEDFRSLNRRQKIEVDNFTRVKAPSGVRKRWEYTTVFGKTITIDLIYHSDGSYEFKLQ